MLSYTVTEGLNSIQEHMSVMWVGQKEPLSLSHPIGLAFQVRQKIKKRGEQNRLARSRDEKVFVVKKRDIYS